MPRPRVQPVLDEDLDEFTAFIFEHMGGDSPAMWRTVFSRDWCAARPNYGFMLKDEERIVGAIGGIYATRTIRGKEETFCNISCWFVLPEYRKHSLRLATALVAQKGYHLTDFTPTKIVADSLRFLKFAPIKSGQIQFVNIPWIGSLFSSVKVIDDRAGMLGALQGPERKVLEDHLEFPWLRNVVIIDGGKATHIVYRAIQLPRYRCAIILGVSDHEQFTRHGVRLRSYLAERERILCTRVEKRFLTRAPRLGWRINRAPRKLFYSETLGAEDVDNLYSELVSVDLPDRFF